MDFKNQKPIYQQIIELIEERIASGLWAEGGRIPSVRELGAELEVNPNTVMRAFERLCTAGMIESSRGIGYSVCAGAREAVREQRRAEFITTTLPTLFEQMDLFSIPFEQIEILYRSRLRR